MRLIKVKQFIAIGIISTAAFSCQSDESTFASNEAFDTETEVEEKTEEFSLTRLDKTERRVNELMEVVRQRSERLERWEDQQSENISQSARLNKKRLKEDFERLEKKLEATLEEVERIAENHSNQSQKAIQSQLETTEDELRQIEEELEEWRELND